MNDNTILTMHFNDKFLGKITSEASDQLLKYAETHNIRLERAFSFIDWGVDCVTISDIAKWKKEVLVKIKIEDD
jgi:hypothetical protein